MSVVQKKKLFLNNQWKWQYRH